MAVAINGRKIEKVCTICGMKYGKRPTPNPQAEVVPNQICDVCEELGTKSAPQSVRLVEAYNGLRIEGQIVKYTEPKI